MVDDELSMIAEEFSKTSFSLRSVENIVLVDLDHGESAPLGVHLLLLFG
jgi:hypothetical protein